jgi:hypothetical protein
MIICWARTALFVAFGHPQTAFVAFEARFDPPSPLIIQVQQGDQYRLIIAGLLSGLSGQLEDLRIAEPSRSRRRHPIVHWL